MNVRMLNFCSKLKFAYANVKQSQCPYVYVKKVTVQIFLYLDTYECSKHGKNCYKFFGCLFGRESQFIFAVRERFHLRKQNFIKLGGAYVTSTGEPSKLTRYSAQ